MIKNRFFKSSLKSKWKQKFSFRTKTIMEDNNSVDDNNSVVDDTPSNIDESRDEEDFTKEIFGTKVTVRMNTKAACTKLLLNPATRLIDEINKEREQYIRERYLKELRDKEDSTHQYLKQIKQVARKICGPGMKLERLKQVREVIQRPLLQCRRPNSLTPIEFHEKSHGAAENILAYKKRSKLVNYRPHEVPYVSILLILEWKTNKQSRPCNHGVCQNKSPFHHTVVSRCHKPADNSQPRDQMKTTSKARIKASRQRDFKSDRFLSIAVKAIRDELVFPIDVKELNSLLGQIRNLDDVESCDEAIRAIREQFPLNKTKYCCNSKVCALNVLCKTLRDS